MESVGSIVYYALYDRGELYEVAVYILEEMIEFKRMLYVEVVDNCQSIPFYIIFIKHSYATHHLVPCRSAGSSLAVGIVKLLWSVNRYAYKEIIVMKELAPFFCQHCGIGLNAVVDASSASVLLL